MTIQPLILASLIQADGFISGRLLAERLNVSRSACWKQIEILRTRGLTIESNRHGYRLDGWSEALESTRFQRFLRLSEISSRFYNPDPLILDQLDSTNLEAKRMGQQGAVHGSIVMAKEQTAGRGRLGRAWDSPQDGGLYMSLLLRPDITPQAMMPLTLMTALVLRDTLAEFLPDVVGLKWPNDIIYNGRKICGILLEAVLEDLSIRQLVMGVGINVNQERFPDELKEKACSIRQITALNYDPNYLAARLLEHFATYYERFVAASYSLDPFIADYRAACVTIGRPVMFERGSESEPGVAEGVSREGLLMVRLESGDMVEVGSGEVQVRGLLGYS